MTWETQKAAVWGSVLKQQRVLRVEPAEWPRICQECDGEEGGSCWKCNGTGRDEPEPAVTIIFANGAELMIRSEYAAALFLKKE
jgi:DnaJ-class molecular chaperone